MKKRTFITLFLLMMVLLSGCGGNNSDYTSPEEEFGNQEYDPEWEAEQEKKYDEEQYGLDLSMYDSHGEWSSDRMWVHKTEESWDAVKGYYGYIDREGQLCGEWHIDGESENDTPGRWRLPGDFVGDHAVVLCRGTGDGYGNALLDIIDKDGKSILSSQFWACFETYSYQTNEAMLFDFARKLNDDVLFIDSDTVGNVIYMMWIDDYGTLKDTAVQSNARSAYWIEDLENGYYPFLYYYKAHYNASPDDCQFGLIDQNGIEVFYKEWEYEVTEITPHDNQTLTIEFIGVDENKYQAILDFNGDWVEEPVKVN